MGSIHIIDYIIFVLSIVVSFCIGLYYACARDKNKTTEDYLLASRKMHIIPVAISFMASFFSAIAMLGNASEIYYYGIEYWFVVLGIFTGAMIVSVTYVPLLNPLKITTIHEYLLMRYNSRLIVFAGLFLQSFACSLINGVVLFGQAIVLQSFANIPIWASILGSGFIATIYTTIGGYEAVIWSDVFQSVIMFVGMTTINILGTIKVGGPAKVWELYSNEGKLDLNWNLSPFERTTMWTFTLGAVPLSIIIKSCQQVSVQRYCSLPSVKHAQRSIYIATVPQLILLSLSCMSGVVAFAYFVSIGCDPLRNGDIHNPNQIIPHFLKEVLNYPTVPGLFMACVACGTFSNLSSSFNSISAMVWQDFLNDKLKGKQITERHKTLITKLISFIAGVCSTCGGFIVSKIGGTLIQVVFTISTAAIAPVWVFVTLGALTPRASWKSAVAGGLVAPAIIIWLNTGNNLSGANTPVLDTVITNCSNSEVLSFNSTHYNYINNSVDIEDKSQFLHMVENINMNVVNVTQSNVFEVKIKKKPAFILYRMSFILIAPFGAFLGLMVGIIFSFIPGFTNKDDVGHNLIFPFVNHIWTKLGYQGFQQKSKEMYVADEKQGGFNEFGSFELKTININTFK